MARETTTSTLDNILLRTVARLIDQVTDAGTANTYISTVPQELPPNPAEFMFEVSPSNNYTFEEGHMTGGGTVMLHCITEIVVTIHVTGQPDQQGRDDHYLTHTDRGVIKQITGVLKALSIHDLQDAAGNELLSHPMRPVQGTIPPKDERKRGFVSLFFQCEFDWWMS